MVTHIHGRTGGVYGHTYSWSDRRRIWAHIFMVGQVVSLTYIILQISWKFRSSLVALFLIIVFIYQNEVGVIVDH